MPQKIKAPVKVNTFPVFLFFWLVRSIIVVHWQNISFRLEHIEHVYDVLSVQEKSILGFQKSLFIE